MKKREKDLYPLNFDQISWDPADPAGAVEQIASAVSQQAEYSIQWYLNKKRLKKCGAQLLRVFAILLTTVAALIPILAEIYTVDGKAVVSSAWSTVALVLALCMVLIDRFFGFSSGWMRFISTELTIREAFHAFQMDWQILRAGLGGGQPDVQWIRQGLERCQSFLAQIDSLLRAEADSWIAEFRETLREIDEAAKARAELARTDHAQGRRLADAGHQADRRGH